MATASSTPSSAARLRTGRHELLPVRDTGQVELGLRVDLGGGEA